MTGWDKMKERASGAFQFNEEAFPTLEGPRYWLWWMAYGYFMLICANMLGVRL